VIPPEAGDAEVLCGWDEYRFALKRREHLGDDLPASESRALARELGKAAARVLRSPVRSLEGIRAKLILTLVSSVDGEMFANHYVHGKRLPQLMAFRNLASSQLYDAIQAVERLMAAEASAGRQH
jgi:hypothetical protein